MGSETLKYKFAKWFFLKSANLAWKNGIGRTWMQEQIGNLGYK